MMARQSKKIAQSTLHRVVRSKPDSGLAWMAISLAALLSVSTQEFVFASHGHHSGTQRYGDVLIIRHADGTIESRDVGGPTYSGPVGGSPAASHKISSKVSHSGKTKYGGAATSGTKASKAASKRSVARAQTSSHSHHGGASRSDDVIITRNADGSVEARDAQ